ncbi:tol-pal system protein YbgF [Reyranella sp.]|jgi:tol-pal system protein YbgF|uniref:tol-pal system protein YbgF n=1 Tax=Reyranella sp. TaxID=1929291 RepID=UPI002F924252
MKILTPGLLILALALPLAAAAQSGNAVYIDDRLNQLQQSITMLTGQIEQLQYQNQQLQQQMEKMRTDYDFRIDQLEKGGKGGPRPAGPAPAAPSAPPPSSSGPGPQQAATSTASADQLYHSAFKLLQDGDYAGSERDFRAFVQRYPKHVLAGNAQYWLGESYYARRDYQNAMTAFAEGYKVYKTSPKGPDNLLKLGITLAVLGRKSDACAVFARFTQDYPHATDLQKRRIDQERQRDNCR